MKVLAIDASSKSTGIAIFQDEKLIHYQCIIAMDGDSFKRIIKMKNRILEIYKKYKPTNIIMEDVLPQDVKHNQTVYKVLIYLQAMIVLSLYQTYSLQNVQFYTASHWRRICGIKTGRGIKRQSLKKASMQLVKNQYGIKVNDDISDAICLGLAYVKIESIPFIFYYQPVLFGIFKFVLFTRGSVLPPVVKA